MDTPLAPHIETGRHGETVAATYLESIGYRIINRNVRVGQKDEIDIIAFDPEDGVYVFAEVKTRSHAGEYRPDINITFHKRALMVRAARNYMAKLDSEAGWRMDSVSVVGETVTNHYKEVRGHEERSKFRFA